MSGSNDVATATPLLNPATVVDAPKLAPVIEEFVRANAADHEHLEAIAEIRTRLEALVTDEARQLALTLDAAVNTRLGGLVVALVRWAFTEGLRYGGGRTGAGR